VPSRPTKGTLIRVVAISTLLSAIALGGGFGWGFASSRYESFPYDGVMWLRERWVEARRPAPPSQPGRWRERDGRRPWLFEDRSAYTWDQLVALGYAEGTLAAPDRSGVIARSDRAFEGLSLVTSGHAPEAWLMDLDGNVLHRWSTTAAQIFPEQVAAGRVPRPYLRRAKLLPDGDLLTLFVEAGVFRLSPEGAVRWRWEGHAHHDLTTDGQGGVWVLAHSERSIPEVDPKRLVVDDDLVLLDEETGAEVRRFSLAQAFLTSPFAPLLRPIPVQLDGDYFHSNAVVVLDGRYADRVPSFAKGHLMVSVRNQNLVVVIDPRTAEVVWAWRGPWRYAHEPTLVDPGHLLIFDNQGTWPRSRVLEIDPVSQRIVWSFDGGRLPVISETCGTAQRLPNGNTVIVASDTGRVLEVDRGGEIVWEWVSPARTGPDGNLIATVFQAERVWGPVTERFGTSP
jgi:hypothetical protein